MQGPNSTGAFRNGQSKEMGCLSIIFMSGDLNLSEWTRLIKVFPFLQFLFSQTHVDSPVVRLNLFGRRQTRIFTATDACGSMIFGGTENFTAQSLPPYPKYYFLD
jgi:hypothetical protein